MKYIFDKTCKCKYECKFMLNVFIKYIAENDKAENRAGGGIC